MSLSTPLAKTPTNTTVHADLMQSIDALQKSVKDWQDKCVQAQKNAVHPPDQPITRSMLANTITRTTARLVRLNARVTGFEAKICDVHGTFLLTKSHVDFLTEQCGASSNCAMMLSDLKNQSYKPICRYGDTSIMFCVANLLPGVPRQSMVVEFASVAECLTVYANVRAGMLAL